ncbi:MAG: flagellar export chaperone FliS [Gemmatimonadetes bacterium]|nr:flagellar export chaperone FliS [Gemmatimonadota bacterium]
MVGKNANAVKGLYAETPLRTTGWSASLAADKGNLLLMLYEKAIRCMEEALVLIEAGDMIGKGAKIIQAQEIVLQLADSLDKNSGIEGATEIALNLERLYLYIYTRLIRGNNLLDQKAIGEALHLMGTLCTAWEQIIPVTSNASKTAAANA